ncbi:MAG: DUF6115 domain-containing protein [Lachnoclostridium sp.]|nr:DUF6115 domain-containing protein [Lachnospira sp.]MCM1246852.1 DUF6115 domain-containing protein [Lachnoclostridium sp.]MCM1534740.1 DUF6115 domain-containing protein [Clostridium sp.]
MGTLGIILLVIAGAAIAAVSYVLPLGEEGLSKEAKEIAEEEIKVLVAHEVDGVKKRIDDAADTAVGHAMDKTERALERISNEKIMAVNEYSDTVLKEINKNHEEVLFLYDMLNDKHTSLKNTVAKVGDVVKAVRETMNDAEAAVEAYRKEKEGVEASAGSFEQFKKQAEIAAENYTRLKKEAENAIGNYKQLKGETEAIMSSLGQMKRETEATMRRFGQLNLEEAEATVSNFKQLKLEEAEAAVTNFNQINLAEAEAAMNSFRQLKEEAEAVMSSFRQIKEEASGVGSERPFKFDDNINMGPGVRTESSIEEFPGGGFDAGNFGGANFIGENSVGGGLFEEEPAGGGFGGDSLGIDEPFGKNDFSGGLKKGRQSRFAGNGIQEGREYSRNEQILALHAQGKSTVAIAKELGLGVGEVKLVIDLHKNA